MKTKDYETIITLARDFSGVTFAADEDAAWQARFLKRNPGMSFVAEEDGRLVGFVYCGHDGRRATVYHLAVAENERGRGIGSHLMKRVEEVIKDAGIARAQLMVRTHNLTVIAFYEKLGWYTRDELKMMSRDMYW